MICRVALEGEQAGAQGHDAVEALLDRAFQAANNGVKDQAESRGTDMGTTLVAMLVLEGRMGFVANVGDSRAYLHRGEELFQVSRDHSLVAKMVERGRITAEEARDPQHLQRPAHRRPGAGARRAPRGRQRQRDDPAGDDRVRPSGRYSLPPLPPPSLPPPSPTA
jgi:hypothetical protein